MVRLCGASLFGLTAWPCYHIVVTATVLRVLGVTGITGALSPRPSSMSRPGLDGGGQDFIKFCPLGGRWQNGMNGRLSHLPTYLPTFSRFFPTYLLYLHVYLLACSFARPSSSSVRRWPHLEFIPLFGSLHAFTAFGLRWWATVSCLRKTSHGERKKEIRCRRLRETAHA